MEKRINRYVDFHVHYDPLDEESAFRIIKLAAENGISAISVFAKSEIADKADEYIRFGNELGVDVLTGVEYPMRILNKSVDLICLGFSTNHKDIRRLFGKEECRRLNSEIAKGQYNFLISKGFCFDDLGADDQILLDTLLAGEISEKAIKFCQLVSKNPLNRDRLEGFKSVLVEDWDDVFKKYAVLPPYNHDSNLLDAKFLYCSFFSTGREGSISTKVSVEDLIDSVHTAGGVVLYSPEGDMDRSIWDFLKDKSADGVMGWHGSKIEIPLEFILELRSQNLLILGGSDFHPNKNHWQIGVGDGSMFISTRRYFELRDRMKLYE